MTDVTNGVVLGSDWSTACWLTLQTGKWRSRAGPRPRMPGGDWISWPNKVQVVCVASGCKLPPKPRGWDMCARAAEGSPGCRVGRGKRGWRAWGKTPGVRGGHGSSLPGDQAAIQQPRSAPLHPARLCSGAPHCQNQRPTQIPGAWTRAGPGSASSKNLASHSFLVFFKKVNKQIKNIN